MSQQLIHQPLVIFKAYFSLEYVLLLNNIRLKGRRMKRKRVTICSEVELQDPSRTFDSRVLQQRSSNLFDMINSALSKGSNRAYLNKKSLAIKLKQAQKEHCCIDIVNRRSITSSTQKTRNPNASNISELKRQINYLERDELKWDKFPREDEQQNQNPAFHMETASREKEEFQMHFVNNIEECFQPIALKGFRNTFKNNFYTGCDDKRPLNNEEKKYFRCFAKNRKRSFRKYGTLQQENESERSTISRTIHSHMAVSSPFRRYVENTRVKRNQSLTVNLDTLESKGKQAGKKRCFLVEQIY